MTEPADDLASDPEGEPEEELGEVAPELIEPLRRARPWAGFLITAGFAGAVYALALGLTEVTSHGRRADRALVAWAVMGVVAIFPAVALVKYIRAIDRLLDRPSREDLADALEQLGAFLGMLAVTAGVLLALVGLSAAWPG